jgi:hypothetical protein
MNDETPPFRFRAERTIHVGLHERGVQALDQITQMTDLVEEDAVNIALQAYALIVEKLKEGSDVVFRHPEGPNSKLSISYWSEP